MRKLIDIAGWDRASLRGQGQRNCLDTETQGTRVAVEPWLAGPRKIIIHYHIFKNAGTSIDDAFAQAWQSRWVPFERSAGHEPLRPDDLTRFVRERPHVVCVSSHLLKPPAPDGFDVFPVIMFRDPLDRAYSCYSHERRSTPNSRSCEIAQKCDFGGYVEWCIDNPLLGGAIVCNSQTHRLSGAWPPLCRFGLTSRDFRRAVSLMLSLPIVGVVDCFDDFMSRLGKELESWLGKPAGLGAVPHSNVSPERNPRSPLEERKLLLGRELGSRLLERFTASNRFDQALYELAATLAKQGSLRSWRGLRRITRKEPDPATPVLRPGSNYRTLLPAGERTSSGTVITGQLLPSDAQSTSPARYVP